MGRGSDNPILKLAFVGKVVPNPVPVFVETEVQLDTVKAAQLRKHKTKKIRCQIDLWRFFLGE